MYGLPTFKCDNEKINMAYRLAIGDICANVVPYKDGMLKTEKPVMLAGVGYKTPWTRDAAINVWNCGGILMPEVSKNTLLSVVDENNGKPKAGGQYWDAVIWVIGAWWYYIYTGDEDFYRFSITVTENTIEYFEQTEFDAELNLFRGAACYGDGVSAYPDFYSVGESNICRFVDKKPEFCAKTGFGLPMYTLSANCLYYEAYKIAHKMTENAEYLEKADKMKEAINKNFWNEESGRYDYIVDSFGGSTHAEGLGHSFAIIFGVADDEQTAKIIKNQPISKHGIPCLYPGFARYKDFGMARHSETVWPHIQSFWADAVCKLNIEKFEHELITLTDNANRDGYFSEIYHPETGERYGGIQEFQGEMFDEWKSEKRQMWCATGYVHMVLCNLLGMRFEEDGIYIKPLKTDLVKKMDLYGLKYRNMELDIHISGTDFGEKFIPCDSEGKVEISL